MASPVDLYDSYRHFDDEVLDAVRRETFGTDIGQNSWVTIDEYARFVPLLGVGPGHHVLEVASGSGGPAIYLARTFGCEVTGIDVNEAAVQGGVALAAASDVAARVHVRRADATAGLPFDAGAFDAIVCIDAMNHLLDRAAVLREWHRVLRVGGRAWFTDPVVVTGPVTKDELARRSSVGPFLFVPRGVNEQLIEQAGLLLNRQEDVSDNAERVAGRWHDARAARRDALLRLEDPARFDDLQAFFATVRDLARERRLSRVAYVVERP